MLSVKFQEKFAHITIAHHLDKDGTLWGTSGRKIYRKARQGKWEMIAQFPFATPRDYFGFPRLAARAARADKCNIYVNQHGFILGIRASRVYQILPGEAPRYLFSIQGDSVLHGSICEDDEGNFLFGEYFMNPDRKPVHLWKVSSDLSKWELAYTFPAGSIRHIHGIYRDPFNPGSYWAASGDFERECYLYHFQGDFQSPQRFGDGSQLWRAVRLFFAPDHITWLTDSNLDQNYACRLERSSGKFETGQTINASAWYGSVTKEGFMVGFTTVEPGPGILTNHSEILASRDGFHWESIKKFRKDRWRPMKLFKYGVISCPSGTMTQDEFYISGEGLAGLDGITRKISITEKTI